MRRGRYVLVEKLRAQGVRDKYIREVLRTELGLEGDELEAAMREPDASAEDDDRTEPPSASD